MAMIVIAEDDEDVAAVFRRLFTRAGFTVHVAGDGRAALELARQQRPDVVLSDLDMPMMSGLELCRAIRDDPRIGATPVALISGSLQRGDPRAVEVQACDVAFKPFGNGELVAALWRLAEIGPHEHAAGAAVCPLAISAGRSVLGR